MKKTSNVPPAAVVRGSLAAVIAAVCLVAGFAAGWLVRDLKGADHDHGPDQAQVTKEIEALAARVAANPKDVEAITSLGHLYFDTNQPQKAIEAYTKSLALKPGNPDVLTDLGVMYRQTGQTAKALECFDQAASIRPGHEIALYNKGIVLFSDMGDRAGALATFEALLRANPMAMTPDGKPVGDLVAMLRGKDQPAAAPAPVKQAAPGPAPAPAPAPEKDPKPGAKPGMLTGK